MVRVIVVLVSLTLACYPAQAVAPAVLIAKEIVKQIIFDFVEARIEDGIRASFGPCKADLAEDAVKQSRTLTGLLRSSGGGMANIGALGGASSLGGLSNLGAAGGQVRAVRNLQNVQSTADSVAGAANLVGAAGGGDAALAVGQLAGTVSGAAGTAAGMAGSAASVTGAASALGGMPNVGGMGALGALGGQAAGGADMTALMSQMMPQGGGMVGMGGADMQQAMAMMQQMMNAKPLDAAEMNELALILESFGKISEAIQPGSACSADDYRRQFTRITAMSAPGLGSQGGAMIGGVMRMMYTSFKDMQRTTAEAEQMFLQMSADDRAEYVQTTVAEMKDQPPEGRRAFLAMIDAGMLGMPEDMRAAFRKQLAS